MAQRKNCIFIIITAYNRQYAAAFRYKAHKSEEKYPAALSNDNSDDTSYTRPYLILSSSADFLFRR